MRNLTALQTTVLCKRESAKVIADERLAIGDAERLAVRIVPGVRRHIG